MTATARVADVEGRLMDLEQLLALFLLLARSLSTEQDLGLSLNNKALAFSQLATLAGDGLGHVRALTAALSEIPPTLAPDAEVSL